MADCCAVEAGPETGPLRCPRCDQSGRKVDPITVKAVLRPKALATLSGLGHRFCPTASCPIVYFADSEVFSTGDVSVPVFQKEGVGQRTVCYCFRITESDLRREVEATGESTASQRVTAHVKAGRCACEIKNPQGSCCLGNLGAAVKPLLAEFQRVEA